MTYGIPSHQDVASLSITGSAQVLVAQGGSNVIQVDSLSIASGARLDLKDNDLLVRGGNYWQISDLIKSARAGTPRWEGPGIGTSSPRENGKPDQGLAIGEIGSDVKVKFTWNGDVTLDGRINADDLFYIDQGFLQKPNPPKYHDGDLNFDGKINADDYFLIDQAFLNQNGLVLAPERSGGELDWLDSLSGLTIDLRVRSTGAKTAQVTSVGQTITIGVYATVAGSDPLAFQALQSLQGGFASTNVNLGAAKGDLEVTYFRNYFGGQGSQRGTRQDLDGDGDLDIGGDDPSDMTDYFVARCSEMQSAPEAGEAWTVEIATLKFTVTQLLSSGTTEVNFFSRTGRDEAALWMEDGAMVKNGSSGDLYIESPLVLFR